MDYMQIDLHMHSTVSDGTDTPEQILEKVKQAGIGLFSLTDHDAIKGSQEILTMLKEDDPVFIPGVEFSCQDEEGKYHILGLAYDPESPSIQEVVNMGHNYRMDKVRGRMAKLTEEFGFIFPEDEVVKLLDRDNPGKPHIGNLMVKLGYAQSKEQAIRELINKVHFRGQYVRPEEAIRGILGAGGIPILAHPAYGSGDQLIFGEEMTERLERLIGFGLQGLEAFYSGFTPRIRREMLSLAERYDLYITAGSDYHGHNKLIELGDTGLEGQEYPEGLQRFLKKVLP